MDLVIKNARILLESGLVRGGIGVSSGKIALIASDAHLPDAGTTIDAENKVIMPGVIDCHAHIHDPTMLE
ncbi:MAG: allantoinase, partial [Promethearchaeota archaeon]